MIIKNRDIDFRLMGPTDIETVRRWRNAAYVRERFVYKEKISKEAQLKWYRELDKVRNLYFLVHFKGTPCAVASCINIDWAERSGSVGYFQDIQTDWNAVYPQLYVRSSLILSDLLIGFYRFSQIQATVKSDNHRVLNYCRSTGYEIMDDDGAFLTLSCTAEHALSNNNRVKDLLSVISEGAYDDYLEIHLKQAGIEPALHRINIDCADRLEGNSTINIIFED